MSSDKHYTEKLNHLDNFMDWLAAAEKKNREGKVVPFISRVNYECDSCKVVMDVSHHCYGNKFVKLVHMLDDKLVCHLCWDKSLEEAVISAGY